VAVGQPPNFFDTLFPARNIKKSRGAFQPPPNHKYGFMVIWDHENDC
jgi:hypothetical protein